MPPILALEKVSKRSAPSSWRHDIDLALGEGEALGIIGPNGAGKTTLFGIMTGTVPPDAGRVIFDGADITRLSPAQRCRWGSARSFQIPQPFGGMTVFENLVVAAAFGGSRGEHEVYPRCADLLERCGACRQGEPAGGRADAARSQAARACTGACDRAARAAARRGRRRPDRARMPGAGRLIKEMRRPACRSSGSSTWCMR